MVYDLETYKHAIRHKEYLQIVRDQAISKHLRWKYQGLKKGMDGASSRSGKSYGSEHINDSSLDSNKNFDATGNT